MDVKRGGGKEEIVRGIERTVFVVVVAVLAVLVVGVVVVVVVVIVVACASTRK